MPLLYGDLMARGLACATEDEMTDGTRRTYRTHLRNFLKVYGLEETDVVGEEFFEAAENPPAALSGQVVAALRKWRDLHARVLSGADLPATLSGALQVLLQRRGVSVAEVAVLIAVPERTLRDYVDGVRVFATQPEMLEALELYFGLANGTLVGRAIIDRKRSPSFLKRGDGPEWLFGHASRRQTARKAVKKYLPEDFPLRQQEERRRLVGQALRDAGIEFRDGEILIEGKGPGRRTSFWLKRDRWGEVLESEFRALERYKSENGLIARDPDDEGGGWRSPVTARRYQQLFEKFAGWATLSAEKGGLGLAIDQVSLALLVDPDVSFGLMSFELERLGGGNEDSDQSLRTARMLLQEERGWLWRSPSLSKHLPPGWLETAEQNVKLAADDSLSDVERWQRLCAATLKRLRGYGRRHQKIKKPTRPPFEPILPILESQRPMKALEDMHALAAKDLKRMPEGLARDRLFMRLVLSGLLARTVLRIGHFAAFTLGQVVEGRRGGLAWRVPVSDFKNKDGAVFAKLSEEDSIDVDGFPPELQSRLAEYLEEVRPRLLRGQNHEHVFVVPETGSPASATFLSREVQALTRTYLAEEGSRGLRLAGVRPFMAHAYRHIAATNAVKLTGSFEVAAQLLMDSVEVVRATYARFLPSDGYSRATDLVDARTAELKEEE